MAHRRLIIQERITAIVGAALLFSLVGLSYYYSIQITLDDLKYVPSASSPDFTATDVTMSDFNEQGVASQRLAAQSVEHYSDERMMAHQATYHTLDPSKPQIVARADKAESLDGLETVQLTGNVRFTRAASEAEPDLYFETEFLNGFLDLLSLWFLSTFGKKPMHFFGLTGTLTFLAGGIIAVWLIISKLVAQAHGLKFRPVTEQPLFYLALVALVVGVQLFLSGFIAEMISRSSQDRNKYNIRERF